jgi:hypothetical protein
MIIYTWCQNKARDLMTEGRYKRIKKKEESGLIVKE